MKYIIQISAYLFFAGICANAQDITSSLDEAKSSYSDGRLDDARFALEQSLHQIDQATGAEILKILPESLSGINYQEADDSVVGTSLGFGGLFVNRNYTSPEKNISIEVIGDSPLLSGLNAILAMPAIMTSGDPDQKRIKVDGYKSLLQKNIDEDGTESYTIQIPANSTLITFNCSSFSEDEAISMVNDIPVADILKIAQ